MRKLLLALGLLLATALPSTAQNTTCATRPPGDSTNACASTAFVTNATGSGIPATTNVLKGSGTAGSAVAATSGTDYLAPSALPSATTSQLYGGTGGAGAASVVTVGSGLSLSGGTLTASGAGSTISVTHANISTTTFSTGVNSFVSAGYATSGDIGAGCTYVKGTSSGPGAIQDAGGNYWQLTTAVPFNVACFGAIGNDSANDQPPIQAAITAAGAATTSYGAMGGFFCPPGYTYKITSSLIFNIPIFGDCQGWIDYTPTTGIALEEMTTNPTKGFENFNLHFAGLINSTGNTGQATSINASGTIAFQMNMMWFSQLRIDAIYNFTKYGFYCDGTGDVISMNAAGGQHDTIFIGQAPNNGVAVKLESANAATTSCEGLDLQGQDWFQAYDAVELDTTNHTGASTSNTIEPQSIDNATRYGIDLWGSYNTIKVGYTGASLNEESTSSFNTGHFGNNFSTGLAIAYGGTSNFITAPAPNGFPTTQTIASGTVYQNTYGPPVQVCFNVQITNATSSGITGTTVVIGPTSSPTVPVAEPYINAMSTALTQEFPVCFPVQPGWYWKATTSLGTGGSPSVNYSTAQIMQSGL